MLFFPSGLAQLPPPPRSRALAVLLHPDAAQELISPLKLSAMAFPKVHSVWGRLWDELGMSPAGQQPRASLSAKRLNKLGEVRGE